MASSTAWATHNRAGEITYTHVQGLTYEVVITTYTKASALADRPWLYLTWGDESTNVLDSLEREQPIVNLPGDIQRNTYRGTHTYGGPGIYPITVEDPNRNEGNAELTEFPRIPSRLLDVTVAPNPSTAIAPMAATKSVFVVVVDDDDAPRNPAAR